MSLSVSLDHRVGDFHLALNLTTGAGLGVLVGPSGAGKSITLRMIAGIDRPDRGRVALNDNVLVDTADATWVSPQDRRVGMIFQDSLLLPHRTVLDNVALAVRSGTRSDRRTTARRWLTEAGAEVWATRHPHQLSGGQAQRVALARALAGEPRMLLLDEPFNALDPPVRRRLRSLLRGIVDRWQIPTLFVTHDAAETFQLADEVHVIEHGRLTQSGTLAEIRRRPQSNYVGQLTGTNLLTGNATGGVVETGQHRLHIARPDLRGPVTVSIAPTAVSVHRRPPEGSPRNSWQTVIERIDHIGDRTRLETGPPLPIMVEVTSASAADLSLEEGDTVWLALKATEIDAEAEGTVDRDSTVSP